MLTAADAIDRLRTLPEGPAVLDAVARTPGAWVVGGAVRDALLDRSPRELDVVVDGDLATLLAQLGGDVVRHERFGTVTVTLPGAGVTESAGPVTVDVAQARRETYAAPGVLPEVQAAPLDEDLRRRDLTVNAIAIRPDAGSGATLRAVDGALGDLERGVLRILHDRSFTDDPTRVWRVARYAVRLGFAVDRHTATLAAAADPATVTGVRLGNELRLALREHDPRAALRRAAALNGRLLPAGADTDPRRLDDALALLPVGARTDLVILAACCACVDSARLVAWVADMGFTAAERDIVAAGSRASTYLPLHRASTGSEIARAVRGVPVEVVALAGGPQAERWIRELAHVRLAITGADLLAAGVPEGPTVGRVLQAVLDARLDGTLGAGHEAELVAARAVASAATDGVAS